jgi:hypothetical protein
MRCDLSHKEAKCNDAMCDIQIRTQIERQQQLKTQIKIQRHIISPCRKAKGRDYSDEFIADFQLVVS